MTNEATIALLERAKTELMKRGWGKAYYCNPSSGHVCTMGALFAAGGNLDAKGFLVGSTTPITALAVHVLEPLIGHSCIIWNDDVATSANDVIDLFDQGIIALKEASLDK